MENDLFNVQGLSWEDAQQYVFTILTELKLREKSLKDLLEKEKLWRERLDLAQKSKRDDLILAAQAELDALGGKKDTLRQEIVEFQVGIEKLRAQLKLLPGDLSLQSSDQLIAELSLLVGDDPQPASQKFDELGIEQELENLKKNLS